MGLREEKAERTRRRLVEVALDLFCEQGYDETVMEQIAARAEVGTSTLYRYFPSKDLLLLDRLVRLIDPAPFLRARPEDEPLEVAIARALREAAAALDDPAERIADIRPIIDSAPGPRARLFDYSMKARHDLEEVIAARTKSGTTDISVRMTAGTTLAIFQMIDEVRRERTGSCSYTSSLEEILLALPAARITLPTQNAGAHVFA